MYVTKGKYNIINKDTLVINELPIGKWTQNYKEFLDSLLYDKTKKQKFYILDYEDHSTDISVQFVIKVESHILQIFNVMLINIQIQLKTYLNYQLQSH